ncbi:MAG TPA: hypothetical protein VFL85_02605 [Candidatus Saccharimonadales bacterium]|nr:hypothetical protein [Candidatus Saccharimonadales bacterium]
MTEQSPEPHEEAEAPLFPESFEGELEEKLAENLRESNRLKDFLARNPDERDNPKVTTKAVRLYTERQVLGWVAGKMLMNELPDAAVFEGEGGEHIDK